MMDNKSKEVIVVENLKSGYSPTHYIINGVSTKFYENEIKVIMGTSGCGKTTFVKTLVGLVKVYEGRFYLFGEDFITLESEDRNRLLMNTGFTFQNGALIGSYKVWENVALPLVIHTKLNLDIIKDIVYEKLKLVGLENAGDKLPKELSGGMMKRAGIARAIINDPKILFCDEPSAGLDPITSRNLDETLISLKENLNLSIIVVSHEMSSILTIADSIIFLNNGKVEFDGKTSDAVDSSTGIVNEFFSIFHSRSGK